MAQIVTMGATMQCNFGAAPGILIVAPTNRVLVENEPAATVMDFVPFTNIPPFGVCNSPANPAAVAAKAVGATAPCTPAIVAPWVPGSPTVLIGNMPALNNSCKLICMLGGGAPCISITNPGSTKTQVP